MPRQKKQYKHAGLAGCVTRFTSRDTGLPIGIYNSHQAELEDDPKTPWAVVCEKHHTLVFTETLAMARSIRSGVDFCDDCREAGLGEPPLGLGYMQGRGAS